MSFAFKNFFSEDDGDAGSTPGNDRGHAPAGGERREGSGEGAAGKPSQRYLVSELVPFIPPAILAQSGIPMEKELALPMPADGSSEVRLSTLYQACPDLFAAEITPLNDSTVPLPPRLGASEGFSGETGGTKRQTPGITFESSAFRPPSASDGSASDGGSSNAGSGKAFDNPFFTSQSSLGKADPSPPSQEGSESASSNPFAGSGAFGGTFSGEAPASGTRQPSESPPSMPSGTEPSGAAGDGRQTEAKGEEEPAFADNPFQGTQAFSTLFSQSAEEDDGIPFPGDEEGATAEKPAEASEQDLPFQGKRDDWPADENGGMPGGLGAMFQDGGAGVAGPTGSGFSGGPASSGFANEPPAESTPVEAPGQGEPIPDGFSAEPSGPVTESREEAAPADGASGGDAPAPRETAASSAEAAPSPGQPESGFKQVFTGFSAPTPTGEEEIEQASDVGESREYPAAKESSVEPETVFEFAPSEPAPAESVAAEPAPVESAPAAPAPVEPAPVEPVEPVSAEPAITEPAPAESVAAEPAPVEPARVESGTAEPEPTVAEPVDAAEETPATAGDVAAPAGEVAVQEWSPEAPEPEPAPAQAPPPASTDEERDLELRAIFTTDESFTLAKVARRVVDLPGIKGCALATPAKMVQASHGEESRLGDEAREMVQSVRNLAAFTGVPGAKSFTVLTDRGTVTLFLEGDCCLTVNHESGSFAPGVREKLILIARSIHKLGK